MPLNIPAGVSFHSLLASAQNGEVLLDHSGSKNERLDRAPEAAYIELWMKMNAPGRDLLAKVLGRWPTQQEATVAADVIQWLGTAVGLGFIREAELMVDRREAEARARAAKS